MSFHSKVAGATQRNPDGTERQKVIASCAVNESLHLLPEPENEYSAHAIRVARQNGQQLGYLPDTTAKTVSKHIAAGGTAWAHITDLTGGTRGKPTRGANLFLHLDDGVSGLAQAAVQARTTPKRKPRSAPRSAGCSTVVLIMMLVFLFLVWI